MKNMKERFHKLITVILCFLVSMVSKRDEVDASVIGQAVTASPVNEMQLAQQLSLQKIWIKM